MYIARLVFRTSRQEAQVERTRRIVFFFLFKLYASLSQKNLLRLMMMLRSFFIHTEIYNPHIYGSFLIAIKKDSNVVDSFIVYIFSKQKQQKLKV